MQRCARQNLVQTRATRQKRLTGRTTRRKIRKYRGKRLDNTRERECEEKKKLCLTVTFHDAVNPCVRAVRDGGALFDPSLRGCTQTCERELLPLIPGVTTTSPQLFFSSSIDALLLWRRSFPYTPCCLAYPISEVVQCSEESWGRKDCFKGGITESSGGSSL